MNTNYWSRRASYLRKLATAIDNLMPDMDRIDKARAYRAEAIECEKRAKLSMLGTVNAH